MKNKKQKTKKKKQNKTKRKCIFDPNIKNKKLKKNVSYKM